MRPWGSGAPRSPGAPCAASALELAVLASHSDQQLRTASTQCTEAEELRRGVPLCSLFARLGRVMRTRADTLTVPEQQALFGHSHKVEAFDCFISHVCSTSGRGKYITLVLDQLGLPAFVIAVAVSLGIYVFQARIRALPGTANGQSWLELCGAISVAWSVYAFGHVLCRRTTCFFDAVSICQHHPELKAAGIRSIPAFVESSREVLVLWDERYFTRLWCVYEIAMAQSMGIPIRILPIGMYVVVAVTQLYAVATLSCKRVVDYHADALEYELLVWIPVFAIQAYAGRRFGHQLAQIQQQLDRFDVRSAGISVESDRILIYKSIEAMFDGSLDNYNEAVRTSFKSVAMRGLTGQRAVLPYWGVLWQSLVAIPYMLTKNSFRPEWPFIIFEFADCLIVLIDGAWYFAAALELGRRSATCVRATRPAAALLIVGIVCCVLVLVLLNTYFVGFVCGALGLGWPGKVVLEAVRKGCVFAVLLWAYRPHAAPMGEGAMELRWRSAAGVRSGVASAALVHVGVGVLAAGSHVLWMVCVVGPSRPYLGLEDKDLEEGLHDRIMGLSWWLFAYPVLLWEFRPRTAPTGQREAGRLAR